MVNILAKCTAVILLGLLVLGPEANAREYKLGVGDQLRIKVHEWPDLDGEVSIGSDGSVSLSLVGQVPAENLSTIELAREIAERLKRFANLEQPPSTVIEVAKYRPFFIVGDVQTPGEYPYRPGLTVLKAISIAGGLFRPAQREAIEDQGQLALLKLEIDQLLARKARISAQLNDLSSIDFPTYLLARNKEPYVKQVMDDEQLLFKTDKHQYAQHLEVLNQLQNYFEAEVKSLSEQLVDLKAHIPAFQKQLEGTKTLVERGLAATQRQLDMEALVLGMVTNQRQLETNILRAKQSVAETQQKILDRYWERRSSAALDSQKTEASLQAAQQRWVSTRKLLLVQRGLPEEAALEPIYEVIRRSETNQASVIVEEDAEIEPGDILRVRTPVELALPDVGASNSGVAVR